MSEAARHSLRPPCQLGVHCFLRNRSGTMARRSTFGALAVVPSMLPISPNSCVELLENLVPSIKQFYHATFLGNKLPTPWLYDQEIEPDHSRAPSSGLAFFQGAAARSTRIPGHGKWGGGLPTVFGTWERDTTGESEEMGLEGSLPR
jgi:hypothetical protein